MNFYTVTSIIMISLKKQKNGRKTIIKTNQLITSAFVLLFFPSFIRL